VGTPQPRSIFAPANYELHPGGAREESHPFMRSSQTLSLFSERPEQTQQPYSFLFSILVHGVVIGLLLLGLLNRPKIKPPRIAEHYVVRHLDLQNIETEMQRAIKHEVKSARKQISRPEPLPSSHPEMQRALQQIVQAPKGPQTLVQPDIPKPVALKLNIPVPTVVNWNVNKTQSKVILAPQPVPPPVADVKPSVQMPNEEPRLADIAIAPIALPTHSQPILASTTSPIVVQGPKPTPPAPITTTAGSPQPTSAAVMSLSEHHMANGPVTLPPVNQSASTNTQGGLAVGTAKEPPSTAHDDASNKKDSSSTKKDSASTAHNDASSKNDNSSAKKDSASTSHSDAASKNTPADRPGSAQGSNSGSPLGTHSATAHITRPKEGQFGSVVVGATMEDKYPETAEQWSGRMAYTVYLPVGLAKSWILQYSLPRGGEASSAHIDAPWPYNIVRPNIAPGSIDADALMIHGFVNQDGHFEGLAIAFPPDFAQAQFVLSSLAQWQFRAATQNGQNVKVEVLLIIPEVEE